MALGAGTTWTCTGVALGVAGTHTLVAVARNALGASDSSAAIMVTLDIVNPAVALLQPAAGYDTNAAYVLVRGTAVDNNDTLYAVQYLTTGGDSGWLTVTAGTFSGTVPLRTAVTTITFSAADSATNSGTAAVSVNCDTVAPGIIITRPGAGYDTTTAGVVTVGTVSDANDTPLAIYYSTDAGASGWLTVSNGTFSGVIPLTAETTVITYSGTDSATNTGTATVTVHYDTSPALFGAGGDTDEPMGSARGLYFGNAAWGDYDGDGDLDFAALGDTGGARCLVYRNNGGGNFSIVAEPLGAGQGMSWGAVAWGDYDGDGDLDLAVSGLQGVSRRLIIYRNTAGAFAAVSEPLGPGLGLAYSALAWGDADNDGDLDLAVSGQDASGTKRLAILTNTGAGVFTAGSEPLGADLGLALGALAFGDIDGDGDLDLAASGQDDSNRRRLLICGNSGGAFTVTAQPYGTNTGMNYSALAWGDADNDGDLDLAVSGHDGGNRLLLIYRNAGGTLTADTQPTGLTQSAVAWGDYDNDGDLDLAAAGTASGGNRLILYKRNAGALEYDTEPFGSGYGLTFASLAWGDDDSDGDLDLLATGMDNAGRRRCIIFRNAAGAANARPAAPVTVAPQGNSFYQGTTVTLQWNAPADGLTPAAALSYSVRIGSNPGGCDIMAADTNSAHVYHGTLLGNVQLGTTFPLTTTLLPEGTYYWAVQALDNGQQRSTWSATETFTILAAAGAPKHWYVNVATGDTGNSGLTPALAKKYLRNVVGWDGIGLLHAGDTIHVAAGTYSETVSIDTDYLTILGADSTTTIIDAGDSSTAANRSALSVAGRSNLVVRHLTVRNGRYGIRCDNVDYAVIDDVAARHCGADGMLLAAGSDNATVSGCSTYGNTGSGLAINASTLARISGGPAAANGGAAAEFGSGATAGQVLDLRSSANGAAARFAGSTNCAAWRLRSDGDTDGIAFSGAAASNRAAQCTIRSPLLYAARIGGTGSGDSLVACNVYLAATRPDSGIWCDATGTNYGGAYNWWNSTGQDSVTRLVSGSSAAQVSMVPYRLGAADTRAQADTFAPAPVSITRVDTAVGGLITVQWTKALLNRDGTALNDFGGYRVYRDTDPQQADWKGRATLLGTVLSVADTQFKDLTATAGDTYYYRVTVIDTASPFANESWFSDTAGTIVLWNLGAYAGEDTAHGVAAIVLDGRNSVAPLGDTLVAYLWTQVSGAAAAIVSPADSYTLCTGALPGTYVFALRVTDFFGVQDTDYLTVVIADSSAPGIDDTAVIIAGGADTTLTETVTLALYYDSVAVEMMLANDSAFTGGVWETVAVSCSWVLSTTGSETKSVYVKFRSIFATASGAAYDTIVLVDTGIAVSTLPAPQGLLPQLISAGGGFYYARLTWQAAPDTRVTRYHLYYETDRDGSDTLNHTDSTVLDTYIATPLTSWTSPFTLAPDTRHVFALRSADAAGEEQNADVQVSIYVPAAGGDTGTAYITTPLTGQSIYGTRVLIMAALGTYTEVQVRSVRFQYKRAGETQWTDIAGLAGAPNPDVSAPFYTFWNVNGTVASPGVYLIRSLLTLIDGSTVSSVVYKTVTAGDALNPDIYETDTGSAHVRYQRLYNDATNYVYFADYATNLVTELVIPAGALGDTTDVIMLREANSLTAYRTLLGGMYSDAGEFCELQLQSGDTAFAGGLTVALYLPYTDANDDGILDGTTIREGELDIWTYNETTGVWERVAGTTRYTDGNRILARLSHFSLYAVLAPAALADLDLLVVYPNPYRPNDGDPDNGMPYVAGNAATGIIFNNLAYGSSIELYDLTGARVARLVPPATTRMLQWSGHDDRGEELPTGVYYYIVRAGGQFRTGKVAIIR